MSRKEIVSLLNECWDHLRHSKLPLATFHFPIISWLPTYTRDTFFSDFIAGLTVFVLLIPQGMAYSVLAGMPPVYGLYTASFPMFIYACTGTSRHISMGPMAITSLLLGSSASTYGVEEGSAEYIAIVSNLTLVTGLFLFGLGIFKLGVLSNFLSHSVLTGFVTASALLIAVSQLKYIFGIPIPRFPYTHQTLLYLLQHLPETNGNAFFLGVSMIAFLYAVKQYNRRLKAGIPKGQRPSRFVQAFGIFTNASSLIAIVIGMFVSYLLIETGRNIRIIGTVPAGLLAPGFVTVDFPVFTKIVQQSFVIAVIAFAGNWAVARKFAAVYDYDVDASQELMAYGITNIIGVFFHSIVLAAGLARSAVNVESGAKTQISSCVAAFFIILALLFLTPIFYYIPMTILGSVIEVSVISMMDFDEMLAALRVSAKDGLIMISTFLVTFFVGISEGVFFGVALSIGVVMNSTAFPPIVELGRLPEAQGGYYRNIIRFPEASRTRGVTILRMDASLYFANAASFKEAVLLAAEVGLGKKDRAQLQALLTDKDDTEHHSYLGSIKFPSGLSRFPKLAVNNSVDAHSDLESTVTVVSEASHLLVHVIVLDVSAWLDTDYSGVRVLKELCAELKPLHAFLVISGAKGPLRDRFSRSKISEVVGSQMMFPTLQEAVEFSQELIRTEEVKLVSLPQSNGGTTLQGDVYESVPSVDLSEREMKIGGSDDVQNPLHVVEEEDSYV